MPVFITANVDMCGLPRVVMDVSCSMVYCCILAANKRFRHQTWLISKRYIIGLLIAKTDITQPQLDYIMLENHYRALTNVRAPESPRIMIEILSRISAYPKFGWYANCK